MKNRVFEILKAMTRCPSTNQSDWLGGAGEGVDFLTGSNVHDETVLFAKGPHLLIQSVLASTDAMNPPRHADISKGRRCVSFSYEIQKPTGFAGDHRFTMGTPLNEIDCKSFVGGEKLTYVRPFKGKENYVPPIEISQKLVHAFDIHYIKSRSAYCRLNKTGDFDDIINIYESSVGVPGREVRVATIQSRTISEYMVLTGTNMVTLFDFVRFIPGKFNGWPDGRIRRGKDIFYNEITSDHCSLRSGHLVFHPTLTAEKWAEEFRKENDPSMRKYESFWIIDIKNNNEIIETSCSPDQIVNYSTDSTLPSEMSPAFFRPDVLNKYRNDQEKYKIDEYSISCRGGWELRSYHINKAGQVHAYIGDLAELPYSEQKYWASFNEHPRSGISERAVLTDFRGQFPTTVEPVEALKFLVRKIDKLSPTWWNHRGEKLIGAVHGMATDSESDWGNELLALDQLVVEGFKIETLRNISRDDKGKIRQGGGPLKLIRYYLDSQNLHEKHIESILAPLFELHSLRNSVKAHSDKDGRKNAIADAQEKHKSLKNHFTKMLVDVGESLNEISSRLPK